jgi:hypothetical protein
MLAAVLALARAHPAFAHEATFPSTVTIHFYDAANPNSGPSRCGDPTGLTDCFYGHVGSNFAPCTRHRVIAVYDRDSAPPMKVDTAPVLVGEGVSDAAGRWVVLADNPGTHTFFAVAKRRTITRPGHTHLCRRALSPDLKVTADFG